MRPDAHTLLAAYAADAVDSDERRDVEAHLASCPTCAEDLLGLRETLASMAEQFAEPPPSSMRSAVLAAAAATPQVRPATRREVLVPSRPGNRVAARRSPLLFALAAGFAALTVLGTATAAVLWQQLQDARDERSGTAAILAAADGQVLRATADLPPELAVPAGSGDVVAVASESSDAAVIVTSGLPDAPDGRDWQVWYLGDNEVRSAGLVDPAGGVVQLDGALGDASAIAVSLEPEGGSQAPTTEPVAVLALSS